MRFVLQLQTIEIINNNNKVQTEKENMEICCRCLYLHGIMRSIKLQQNKRADKFTGKSKWLRKRVRVLEIITSQNIDT